MQPAGQHGATAVVSARVQALSARNLQLLQAIEGTVSQLSSDAELLRAVAAGFQELHDRLEANVPEGQIDRDGSVGDAHQQAAEAARRMYKKVKDLHQSACKDSRLTQEDGVAGAYEEYLEALESLFDTVESLHDWIETHDALLEPSTGKVYTDVDDLFAALED